MENMKSCYSLAIFRVIKYYLVKLDLDNAKQGNTFNETFSTCK